MSCRLDSATIEPVDIEDVLQLQPVPLWRLARQVPEPVRRGSRDADLDAAVRRSDGVHEGHLRFRSLFATSSPLWISTRIAAERLGSGLCCARQRSSISVQPEGTTS